MELSVNLSLKRSPATLVSSNPRVEETPFVPVFLLRASVRNSELTQSWISEPSLLPEATRKSCQAWKIVMQRAAEIRSSRHVHIYISRCVLEQYTDSHNLPRLPHFFGCLSYHCPVLTELARLALPYVECPTLFSSAFLDEFQHLLCGQLVHAHRSGLPEPVLGRGGLSTWQRRTVTEFMTRKRFANITLSELAERCQLSSSHFARSFKVSFGQPVHAWVLKQRVVRAKRLMLESDEQLVEIAFHSGFPDQTTFNRTFLKSEGISPGRWKRIHKQ